MDISPRFKLDKLAWLLAAAAVALVCAAFLGARPAAAACPVNDLDCEPGPGGTTSTVTHTLTVTRSQGTVTSSPADVSCPSDCTAHDSQIVNCTGAECDAPDPNGWTPFTLTASGGPVGFSPVWTGCDSVAAGACHVTLTANKAVSLAWIDTTDPTLNTLSVTNVSGKVGALASVSATASDNDAVNKVEWFLGVSAVPALTRTPAQGLSGVLDLSLPSFADGSSLTIRARATDASGRESTERTVTVTIDKHVGLTLGTVPAFTNASAVPLGISTDSDATMTCALSGAAVVPAATCAGSYSPVGAASPDGAYTYGVTATDVVGNQVTGTRSFVLDRTAPALTFTDGPTEGQIVGTPTLSFGFTEADANPDALDCRLDTTPIACGSGQPVALAGLTNGTHAFTVHATDKAGNERTVTRNFAVSLAGSGGGAGAGAGQNNDSGGTPQPSGSQAERLVVSLKVLGQHALKKKRLALTFTSNRPFKVAARVMLRGKLLARFSRQLGSGKSTVNVRLAGKALTSLRRALGKKKTTSVVLKLTYLDQTGAQTQLSKHLAVGK